MKPILSELERVRLSTESGRRDIEETYNNPSAFYYRLRGKGEACIEALRFLAEHLPEAHQEKLFTHQNVMPLLEMVFDVGAAVGDKLDVPGMPLIDGTKRRKFLKLDKDGKKIREKRIKRIRNIVNELLIYLGKTMKGKEIAKEGHEILNMNEERKEIINALSAITLQVNLDRVRDSRS